MRPPLRSPQDRREQELVAAVGEAVGLLGMPVEGMGVLRAGTSLLVGLPEADLLARVDRPILAARATRQVQVARLLETCSVPAVRSHDALVRPLPVDGGPVMSLWRWEEVADRVATPSEVGALAGHLHRSTLGAPGLAALSPADPLAASLEQLAAIVPTGEDTGLGEVSGGAAADADVAVLEHVVAELEPVWAAACEREPPVLVHADLHAGNVIVTSDGPLLADLELAGPGPAAYDLAPQVVAERRYGSPPSETADLLTAYGSDRPDPAVVEELVPVYELWVTAWAVSNRGLDADHEAEARLRLERWRGDWSRSNPTQRWTLR